MPDPPKRGWGSLLSGAVAGIESRLDVMLQDDPEASLRERAAIKEKEKALKDASREVSKSRGNDRLKARLAQAVNKEGRRSGEITPATTSRAESPAVRASVDSKREEIKDDEETGQGADEEKKAVETTPVVIDSPRPSQDVPPAAATESPQPERTDTPDITPEKEPDPHADEIHQYLEKIDALHSKIAYLTTQLQDASNKAAQEAAPNSPEKKIAEQESKIAQLIKEGEKLSHDQLKNTTALRTMRSRLNDQDKASAELRRKLEKIEQENTELKDRSLRAEAREKAANDRIYELSKVEKSLATANAERDDALKQVQELKSQVSDAEKKADEAEKNAQAGKAEDLTRKINELTDDLSNATIEKKLLQDRLKAEMMTVKEAHKSELEKSKLSELELRAEVQNLESKLEILRLKTEEASTSNTSESQTKLLRQVETLQTQYALATENWQGIETSLNNRITALEKERDDLAKRESDVRKRSRETNSKARRLEEELDTANEQNSSLEAELSDLKASMSKLEAKLATTEQHLASARAETEATKSSFASTLASRLDDERAKIRAELTNFSPLTPSDPHASFLRTDSFPFRKSSHDHPSSQRRSTAGRIHTDLSNLFPPPVESPRSISRRGSARPGPVRTPTESSLPSRPDGMENGMSGAPSIHTVDVDEEPFPERDSPQRTVAELISVSTAGAGPSVQLVERMSATVRRLEMEKGGLREEVGRVVGQRDQAREEVVELLKEVESFKGSTERVKTLEGEMDELRRRYDTTLEMLGEKTELVEELTADVADLKKIYRELADKMT